MKIEFHQHEKHPESILVRDFSGTVNVDNIIGSWEYLLSNELITEKVVGVINNLLYCDLQMDITSFHTLMDFLKTKAVFKKVKLAVVCNNPKMIIFPTMAEFGESGLKIKPFATEDAATTWILESKN